MTSGFGIYQAGAGLDSRRDSVFGADVANLGLYRALAAHGEFEELSVFSNSLESAQALADLVTPPGTSTARIAPAEIMNQRRAADAGALLRGRPDLHDLAWLRRRSVGDKAYSLLGLVHSIAPPTMRQMIAMSAIGPVQPWDAIVCTSPAVRDGLEAMFEAYGDFLGGRFGGTRRPRPHLPLLPLGVDAAQAAQVANRPGRREALRAELGVGDDEVLILWVGRLSFFEKAFPQPMFAAAQAAAQKTGAKVRLLMAGWFPHGADDEARYRRAALAHAPDVTVSFHDGGDRDRVLGLYGAADIFLSLVDNIQETFGLTPLEAMAAGLPIVASDWDGYRYTMRDGVEAFLIPTLGGVPGGLGHAMALRHGIGADTYQAYVGEVAQHTAVHIGKAGEALAGLIASPDLRARMGAAGRERVRSTFDWSVVIGGLKALLAELAAIRAREAGYPEGPSLDPVKGDPFADFAGFATETLSLQTRLRLRPGVVAADLDRSADVDLDQMFAGWRGTMAEHREALEILAQTGGTTTLEVLKRFPVERRRAVELGLVWLAKLGLIDWLA